MKLDMNNIVIYLLIIFACSMGGIWLNGVTKSLDAQAGATKDLVKTVTGLVKDIEHLKEDDGENERNRNSISKQWELYGKMDGRVKELEGDNKLLKFQLESLKKEFDDSE